VVYILIVTEWVLLKAEKSKCILNNKDGGPSNTDVYRIMIKPEFINLMLLCYATPLGQ